MIEEPADAAGNPRALDPPPTCATEPQGRNYTAPRARPDDRHMASDTETPDATAPSAEQQPPKRVVGRPFVAGAPSANPGGRPKRDALLRRDLRVASRLGARFVIQVLRDQQASKLVKLKAAELALAYDLGRPRTALTIDTPGAQPGAGDDGRARLAAALDAWKAGRERGDTPATGENAQPGASGAAGGPS
jgi:hypothetical protein